MADNTIGRGTQQELRGVQEAAQRGPARAPQQPAAHYQHRGSGDEMTIKTLLPDQNDRPPDLQGSWLVWSTGTEYLVY